MVSLYFSGILLIISAVIVIGLAANKKVAFWVMLYWCVQVVRYVFEIWTKVAK